LQNNSDCVYSFYLPEGDYNFGVQAIYSDGQSDIVEVSTTDAEETELIITPGIHKVYPNPFNPEVTISFSTTNLRQGYGTAGRNTENTEVSIYNIKGQRLRELKIENVKCKMNSVIWDGKDDRGNSVGSGVYFVRFKAGDMVETRKMMLIK
jgi:hypothetical protein